MKKIKLNEDQWNRLFEDIENFGNNDIPDYHNLEQVYTNAKVGDEEGDDPNTDKISHELSPQQWGVVGRRNSTNTI